MNRKLKNILVTGGAGFIGSNFIHQLFGDPSFDGRVINLDKLTYAGCLENLSAISGKWGGTRYFFEKLDIRDEAGVHALFEKYGIDTVVHFAAESHVDRSIVGPADFIMTNYVGTFSLLEAARKKWRTPDGQVFYHVSTDEVYGSLGSTGYFHEDTKYDPRSPYSASKAGADHLVTAYFHTYGLPVVKSNCSNNYGPYQFPEKLIPVMILNMLEGKSLPVYGDGKNKRDWLFVQDHARAIWTILKIGVLGETYNVGGDNEWENIELIHALCSQLAQITGVEAERYRALISFVKDRPGHDRRYAINCDKIKRELGWKQSVSFEEGLFRTVKWYVDNTTWIEKVRSGDYRKWVATNYEGRGR